MRLDHLVTFNEHMTTTRDITDETLAQAQRQRDQLAKLADEIPMLLEILEDQIGQLEKLRHVAGQLAATNGPPIGQVSTLREAMDRAIEDE